MTPEYITKLMSFYEEQIRNCEESLEQSRNKTHTDTSKLYGEGNIRYKEGFRDALLMVMKHFEELEQKAK